MCDLFYNQLKLRFVVYFESKIIAAWSRRVAVFLESILFQLFSHFLKSFERISFLFTPGLQNKITITAINWSYSSLSLGISKRRLKEQTVNTLCR